MEGNTDFNQIVGHKAIIENLKKSIDKDHISHSYLFMGPDSIGKKMVAKSFFKTILCEKGMLEPCNNCSSCRKFDSSNHPDYYYVAPEGTEIKKEQVEQLIKTMHTGPLEGKRKVYIIDDSDTMNRHSQNALLKTLEEPPNYVNIILISKNNENLLPTIISRCEVIKFSPIDNVLISDYLMENYGIIKEKSKFLASYSNGSIGKAIQYSKDESFLSIRDETIEIINRVISGSELELFNSLSFFEENQNRWDEILDIILFWFRDLYIYKKTGNKDLIINTDKLELLSSQTNLSNKKINDIIKNVLVTKDNILKKINYQLSIESMLLKMQEE